MGRKTIPIDLTDLEKLAGLQCSYEEAAAWLGVSKRTFVTRMGVPELREVWERGREKGLTSLRRSQFKLADRNAAMAIFLGKNYLRQRDVTPIEITGRDGAPIEHNWDLTKLNDDDYAALKRLRARAGQPQTNGHDPAGLPADGRGV